MTRPAWLLGVLTAILWCGGGSHGLARQAGDAPAAMVLVTIYADGRTTHAVVTPKPGHSWTPLFPRLPGSRRTANELSVSAVSYRYRLGSGGVVAVDVAVFRGDAHQREDAIAAVTVRRGDTVTVDALRDAGVAPVIFTVEPLRPARLYPPQVLNRTAGLHVSDIEIVHQPHPRYRVTVQNLSSQPALNFNVVAHYGDRPALRGNRGNPDGSPVIAPGETYSFLLSGADGPQPPGEQWAPRSHDAIEITSVLWQDGSIEGEPGPMTAVLGLYAGRRLQLARAIAVLRSIRGDESPQTAKARLRTTFEFFPIEVDDTSRAAARQRLQHYEGVDEVQVVGAMRSALARSRNGLLDDLADAPDEPAEFQRWLAEIIPLYEQWRDRFATVAW